MWQRYTRPILLCLRCLGNVENEQALILAEEQARLIVTYHKLVVHLLTERIADAMLDQSLAKKEKDELIKQLISNIATVDGEAQQILDAVGTVMSALQTETTRTTEETDG